MALKKKKKEQEQEQEEQEEQEEERNRAHSSCLSPIVSLVKSLTVTPPRTSSVLQSMSMSFFFTLSAGS